VLRPFLADYKPFREEFHRLFNSYYMALGEEIPEKKGCAFFSRPSLDDVLTFRAHVDWEMGGLLERSIDEETSRRVMLGLNHEQQHQELVLTDIKHAFFSNPLRPSYGEAALDSMSSETISTLQWHSAQGGLIEIGHPVNAEDPMGFCFDNETPRHKTYLEPFKIANRQVTCREYLEFMSDDRSQDPDEKRRQAGWPGG
jgi:formylglycine-generating enzyme required for sulfatase activity